MPNELFKGAIADVKDLTRIAEENAVHAVAEAVAPRIRELIESRLIESTSKEVDVPDKKRDGDKKNFAIDEKVAKKLAPILEISKASDERTIDALVEKLEGKARAVIETIHQKDFDNDRFEMTVSSVENMYGYVRENLNDKSKRAMIEERLENIYEEMKESIKETEMLKQLNEEDLSLKLSGLPELDDEDLENIEVELVADEGGEEEEAEPGDEEVDLDVDVDAGDEGGGEEELDFGDFEDEDEEEEPFEEGIVYEIDESALVKELKRMKMNEAHSAVDDCCIDDFGGGDDDGDPWLDSDLPDVPGTKDSGPKNVKEGEDLEMDEEEETDEACSESLSKKIKTEKQIKENITRRLQMIKRQFKNATNESSKARLKSAYTRNRKRLTEATKRLKVLTESASRSNNGKEQKAGNNSALVNQLRSKLHETNLVNQKLIEANKVLQERSLSNSQKKKIIESLNKAKTLAEIKAINQRMRKIARRSAPSTMNEGRTRSNSAPLKSSGASDKSVLNESLGVERWQTLAGLNK